MNHSAVRIVGWPNAARNADRQDTHERYARVGLRDAARWNGNSGHRRLAPHYITSRSGWHHSLLRRVRKIFLQGSHSFAGQGMAPAEANTPSGTQSIGHYCRGRCGRRDKLEWQLLLRGAAGAEVAGAGSAGATGVGAGVVAGAGAGGVAAGGGTVPPKHPSPYHGIAAGVGVDAALIGVPGCGPYGVAAVLFDRRDRTSCRSKPATISGGGQTHATMAAEDSCR